MALYNTKLKRERTPIDCLSCEHYDKQFKRCRALGEVCLEIDATTRTLIDPITGLPIKEKDNGTI